MYSTNLWKVQYKSLCINSTNVENYEKNYKKYIYIQIYIYQRILLHQLFILHNRTRQNLLTIQMIVNVWRKE